MRPPRNGVRPECGSRTSTSGLDEYDSREPRSWVPVAWRDNRHPATRGMPLAHPTGCWCGQRYPHDWPGKAEGQAHPR